MVNDKNIPAGYKQTDVGVIPVKWEVKQFGDFAYLSKNYINPQQSKKSFPCIELEHLSQETGLLLGIVESSEQLSQKLIFSRGDVLFGKLRPYLKKFHFPEFDGVCTSEIWVIKSYNQAVPNPTSINPKRSKYQQKNDFIFNSS